jgi:hypothetical protein
VLSATNGVITEERYQKLTLGQWVFQYIVHLNQKKKENNKFEVLLGYLELVGSMANPESGRRLQEVKEMQKHREDINEEKFLEIMDEVKESMPTLIVDMGANKADKFFLPTTDLDGEKKKRKLGISKKEGVDYADGPIDTNGPSTTDRIRSSTGGSEPTDN